MIERIIAAMTREGEATTARYGHAVRTSHAKDGDQDPGRAGGTIRRATGVRVRSLPITVDKVLTGLEGA